MSYVKHTRSLAPKDMTPGDLISRDAPALPAGWNGVAQPNRYRMVSKAPAALNLGRWLRRHGIRGGDRLIATGAARGLFDGMIVVYPVAPDVSLRVPLFRDDNRWDRQDALRYEERLVQLFSEAARALGCKTLIDCGADIGTFSVLSYGAYSGYRDIIAFEPNCEVLPILRLNLEALPIRTRILAAGVSDFEGRGRLATPDYDASCHARFLTPASDGTVPVTTIDSLRITGTIALKIDVEGLELAVLRGAQRTLTSADRCVVAFEANPLVARRTGQLPGQVMRYLARLRSFSFRIAETGETLDPERPPLAAASKGEIVNIIAVSE